MITTMRRRRREQQQQPQQQRRRRPQPQQPPTSLLLLVLLLLAPLEAGAFTVDVPAGSSQCFTAGASSGEEVFGNFEVLTEGSYSPVEVTVSERAPVA